MLWSRVLPPVPAREDHKAKLQSCAVTAAACMPALCASKNHAFGRAFQVTRSKTTLHSLRLTSRITSTPARMQQTIQQQHVSDRVWLLGAAATAVASVATVVPPPPSMWVPVAAIALAIGVFWGLAQWMRPHAQPSQGSSTSSVTANQVLELVRQRRSVYPKDMTGQEGAVTQQQLDMMLEAARWAPTHKLTQPWHFVVLSGNSKAAFEELTIKLCQERLAPEKAEATVAKLRRKQSKDWPKVHCYITICMKRHEEVPEWEEIAAVACAVQNMALTATSLGIGGYWSSWQAVARDSPELHQLLEIDSGKGDRCLGVFVVGGADAERVQGYRPKRQELSEKVVWLH